MKKFFKGFTKKSQSKGSSPGPSPAITRRGGATAAIVGYDVKEKDLGKLHKAAWAGDAAKVKQLAKKDASPLDKQNRTPLHLACARGQVEVAQELLEWKAKTNIGDNQAKTPLMKAVECQQEECVRLLVEYHVELDNKDSNGDTALHIAVREGNIDIADMLIKEGASVNLRNRMGYSPLHLTVTAKREQIAHMLLQENADNDIIDSNERTPLMLACQDGNIAMVKLLLQYKSDTSLKDVKGWSADDIAVMQGHHSCSQLITDYSIKLKHPPSGGSTPRSQTASLFGSAPNTPRQDSDPNPFGAPAADMAGDDSGDETVSRASGGAGGGCDSWADDTDVSLATDDKKSGPHINLAKMVTNASESEEGEMPRDGSNVGHRGSDEEALKANVQQQDSLQSQASLPDDQEFDPKRSTTRVSFKRDEELQQFHEISIVEEESSEAEAPAGRLLNNGQRENSFGKIVPDRMAGYTASAIESPKKQIQEMTPEKIRAFMEELGISDVEDSEPFSEEASEADSRPVDHPGEGGDNSDSTPRPGILKNWKQLGYTDETEIDDYVIPAQIKKAKPLEEAERNESDEEGKDENSEWDSDVEHVLSPRQSADPGRKQEQEFDDVLDDTLSEERNFIPLSRELHRNFSNMNDLRDLDPHDLVNDGDSISDWDSTADGMTPRNIPSGDYFQLTEDEERERREGDGMDDRWDVDRQLDVRLEEQIDTRDVTSMKHAPVQATPPSTMGPPPDINAEEESESAWDSEDEMSRQDQDPVSPRPAPIGQQHSRGRARWEESEEEEEESVSEWELERQREKQRQQEEEEYRQEEMKRQKQEEEAARQREIERQQEEEVHLREMERQREWERQEQLVREREEEEKRQREWEEEQRRREAEFAREAELELEHEREEQERMAEIHNHVEDKLSQTVEFRVSHEPHREEEGVGEEDRDVVDASGGYMNQRDVGDERQELNRIQQEAEVNRQEIPLQFTTSSTEQNNNHGPVKMSLQSDGNSYDEDDSLMSDNFMDSPRGDRNELDGNGGLYYPGGLGAGQMYGGLNVTQDDDGLSFTSTEDIGGELQTVPYNRDILSSMTFGDSGTTLKLQETLREQRRLVEKEKSQRTLMENKHRILLKENNEMQRKVEELAQQRSALEQTKLDLEAENRSLAYNFNEETEKRKNAEVLLLKTKEQLDRKEEQYTSEIEGKQRAELSMRNIQMELRSAQSTIKQLEDEKEEVERQFSHEKNARHLQEQLNEEQQRLHQQLQQESSWTSTLKSDALTKLEVTDDNRKQAQDTAEKLKAELYAIKMELDRQRVRFNDDHTLITNENEELHAKIEDLKNELKLNEEALAHATMNYNVQLSSIRTEASMLSSSLDKERSARDKVETELESLRNRQHTAALELERTQQARNEAERLYQRERNDWSKQMERKNHELSNHKDNGQTASERVNSAEAKASSLENELHMVNTSLLEKGSQAAQLQRELDHRKSQQDASEENYRKEKEQTTKLQIKLETIQDRVNFLQHENLSLKQQSDTIQQSLNDRSGFDINDKFNAMLSSLKTDHDKSRSTVEEKNNSLSETVTRLKEELRNCDNKRMSLEQELKRLNQDHNDALKRLSIAEASLEVTQRVKAQLEQERNQYRMDTEKHQQKYQTAHEKNVESQARIGELVDRLERAEQTSILSNQQLASTSANIQAYAKTREDLEEGVRRLQLENARLETEIKHDKQRVELLQRDLDDSQKVRSSLEALCSNLKTTNAHLEEKLGDETASRTILHQEAEDAKGLWESEVVSRSKLGMRIAQLDRNKQELVAQLEEEKRKVRKAQEAKRIVETKLEAEIDKTAQLQKEVSNLRAYLKSAKKKLRQHDIEDSEDFHNQLQDDVGQKDKILRSKNLSLESMVFSSGRMMDKSTKVDKNRRRLEDGLDLYRVADGNGLSDSLELEHVRHELEAKYRMELNRKLEDVNRYLEEQAQARDRLDQVRNNNEASLKTEKRKLEEELSSMRLKCEQSITEKDSKELESKRFRDLYDSEMKWRMKLGDQLQRSSEKANGYKSRLSTERNRSRLYGSLGNLTSTLTVADNSGLDVDDPLNLRLKAELDRSIAKHLEAGPYDNRRPVFRNTEENPLLNSSLAKSNSDYLAVLKKKYFV